ncbi:unnamed protein product [Echinostoma caproni]|uniref:Nucleos_tra2_N domain-containing protein n=1 Tax=Echinostoma caproni TaxID=27848 RepID=A0A183B8G5_9TREM|nr:unnamed protein product [Echinostoma caproni]
MVSIDFSGVCWYLVSAVSVSKLIAFVLSFVITVLLTRSTQLGLAAILSMFVSQSNDVALGYPVLKALYPDLASYIYLFAPIQLVVLNPFAYFVLEWYQAKQLEQEAAQSLLEAPAHEKINQSITKTKGRCHGLFFYFRSIVLMSINQARNTLVTVCWRVILNPLFFMTVIGVVLNFILKHEIPYYVDGLLKIIAESFAATALFTLGFGMVGKMSTITQRELYILAAILLSKLWVLS